MKRLFIAAIAAFFSSAVCAGLTVAQKKAVRTLNDGIYGVNCYSFVADASIPWVNAGGDWVDANNVMQGNTPFVTFTNAPSASPITTNVDVTAVMQYSQWILRYAGRTGGFQVHTKESATVSARPKLVVTLADSSTVTLSPIADSLIPPGTVLNGQPYCPNGEGGGNPPYNANGTGVNQLPYTAINNKIIIQWPDLPANAVSARLQLTTVNALTSFSDVGIYVVKFPEATWDNETVTTGLAAGYPGDVGIYNHPDVVYHEEYTFPELYDWMVRSQSTSGDSGIRNQPSLWICSSIFPCENNNQRIIVTKRPNSEPLYEPGPAGDPDPNNIAWKNKYSFTGTANQSADYSNQWGVNVLITRQPKMGNVEPDEIYVRYYVKFSPGWDYAGCQSYVTLGCTKPNVGGKLMGISGVTEYGGVGGGGFQNGQGWSARLEYGHFYNTALNGGITNPLYDAGLRGQFYPYLYHLGQVDQNGDDEWGHEESYFQKDTWYCLEEYIKINSITTNPDGTKTPNADGIVTMWVDGRRSSQRTDVTWRGAGPYIYANPTASVYDPLVPATLSIQRLFGSAHEGGLWAWGDNAANGSVYNHYDKVVISKSRIGCMAPAGNNAPTVANPIADIAQPIGQAWTYAFPANTFADVGTLTYSITSGLPGWASFNAGTRTFTGTPSALGTHNIVVRATDSGGLFVEDTFTLSVTSSAFVSMSGPNTVAPGANVTISWGNITNFGPSNWFGLFQVGASSGAHNGNWLYTNCTQTSSGSGSASGSCPFTIPSGYANGAYEIRLHETGTFTQIAKLDIVIQSANNAPVLDTPNPDAGGTEGVPFTYQVAGFSDPNSDTLTYSLPGAAPWLNINAQTGLITATPVNTNVGAHTITIRATDTAGAFVEDTIVITISGVNTAPFVNTKLVAQAAFSGQQFEFIIDPATFGDIDATQGLTLTARSMPPWLSFDGQKFIGLPAASDAGFVVAIVRASDELGEFVETEMVIKVSRCNAYNYLNSQLTAPITALQVFVCLEQ